MKAYANNSHVSQLRPHTLRHQTLQRVFEHPHLLVEMSRQALRVAETCLRQSRHISTHTRPTSFATASYCSISTSATGRRNAAVPTSGTIASLWTQKGLALRPSSSVGASVASGSRRWNSSSSGGASLQSTPSTEETSASKEPRLSLTFTCTAPIPVQANVASGDVPASSTSTSTLEVEKCGHRSSHTFTKKSYEKGIVIIACPSCKNRCVYSSFLSFTIHRASISV